MLLKVSFNRLLTDFPLLFHHKVEYFLAISIQITRIQSVTTFYPNNNSTFKVNDLLLNIQA